MFYLFTELFMYYGCCFQLSTFRCYLFDSSAFLIMDPDFLTASDLHESKYERVQLGEKEGEVTKDLVYKHAFIRRTERVDFQGSCSITPEEAKVSEHLW